MDKKWIDRVTCPDCKYQNHIENIKRYGTCRLCGKILDKKAKFDYEMFCKLKRWRKK